MKNNLFKIITTLLMLSLILVLACKKNQPDIIWTKTYGGSNSDLGYSVQQTSDGGYIITGYTYTLGASNSDIYLIKTDANGDILWTKAYGGSDYDRGYSVQQTSDGGYIITGYTKSFGAGNSDVYLIKTDANGNTLPPDTSKMISSPSAKLFSFDTIKENKIKNGKSKIIFDFRNSKRVGKRQK